MSVLKVYLVVSADRRVRVAKRPQIGMDEVAIAVNLSFPDGWGTVVSTLDLPVPMPPPALVGSEES